MGEINVVEAKRLATIERLSANGKRANARSAKTKPWKIIADQRVVKCHAVVADPPYGITKQPWEPKNLEVFTRDWCGRWSKCGADLIAIFWSQAKLWEGRRWFDESLKSYNFQQLLVWHAKNYVGAKSRWQFKQTWEPIFLYRRVGSTREIAGLQRLWETELHNLDCHVTSGPQTIYNGDKLKQHPCQKPVSVMRWLINTLTEPGELVASPFCGVAPCGIAAVQLGRKYHGIEINRRYRRIAEARITTYGRETNDEAIPCPVVKLAVRRIGDAK